MIDISAKIHDKFSIEFKIGYNTGQDTDINKFSVNTWIFIPYSLDINKTTYPHTLFYRNLRTNIRFITPKYSLADIADTGAKPLNFLKNTIIRFAESPTECVAKGYEYNIKMFSAIFKSALRDDISLMISPYMRENRSKLSDSIMENALTVLREYRSMREIIEQSEISEEYARYYTFGDEFMSNILHRQLFRMMDLLKKNDMELYLSKREAILRILAEEVEYRKRTGYMTIDKENQDNNRDLIYRSGALKKYIESELFLGVDKKRDGRFREQIYMSIAAGISMIFATVVAFSVQQRFGNFTMPLFVALVVSYMLKDRIKDLTRYYFAHKLKGRYFDNKAEISLGYSKIGWSKEAVDYITDSQIPANILSLRNRTPLLEARNRHSEETIILFRKSIQLSRTELDRNSEFYISGINEIIKFNISSILVKGDDPNVPLYIIHPSGEYEEVLASKVYYINFVLQIKDTECSIYKRYLISFNRDGIKDIEDIELYLPLNP